ncbi:MAG: YkgJ family cysteine cluster protein [Promethearchaeota archaeon]
MKYCIKCGNCCLDTEMMLSNDDITNIINKVKPKNKFYEEKDGYLYLINYENRCIFFNVLDKKCTIHRYRPRGCRLYPFIYDNGECVVDKDCLNRENIKYIKKSKSKKVKKFIELLEKERKERLMSKKAG